MLGKNSFRDEIETSENNKVEIIRRLFPASETTERIFNRFPDRSQVHARVYVSPLRGNGNNEIKTFEYTIFVAGTETRRNAEKTGRFCRGPYTMTRRLDNGVRVKGDVLTLTKRMGRGRKSLNVLTATALSTRQGHYVDNIWK